jgi:hypothetical protein
MALSGTLTGTPLITAITVVSAVGFFLMGYDNGMRMERMIY